MTIEEKAIAYDKALERAEALIAGETNTSDTLFYLNDIKSIFPELAESEDERIRKALINLFKTENFNGYVTLNGIDVDDVITWLEKQGEQRSKLVDFDYNAKDSDLQEVTYFIPNGFHVEIDGNKVVIKRGEKKTADKVEPKFHEGDWVVYKNDICQIVKREEGCNKLVTVFGIEKELVNERNLSTARLWSIADAKAGDVLVSGQMIFVFNKLHGVWINCSCSFHKDGSFCEEDYDLMHIRYGKEVYPATKEQRDLLFQKMHEAGYMWDAENKQLLSLKAEPTGEIKGNQGKISPKWSEEDEKCIDNCCLLIGAADDCYEKTFKDDCIYYLQSLKERMEQ